MAIEKNRVAVITVHGVGDPVLGDTARNIVVSLQRGHASSMEGIYSSFKESTMNIPVTTVAGRSQRMKSDKEDIKFTIRALEKMDATDQIGRYRTVRLTGSRLDPMNSTTTKIDVFDMHWADLSCPSSGVMHFLGELYQLFFHLASLGRKTVIAAHNSGASGKKSALLGMLALVHRAIAWLLPTAIPVGNLFFIVPVLALLVLLIPERARGPLAVLFVVLGVFGGSIAIAYNLRLKNGGIAAVVVSIAAGSFAAPIVQDESGVALGYAAIFIGFVCACGSSRMLLDRYEPWVVRWGPTIAGSIVLLLFIVAFQKTWTPDLRRFDVMLLTASWVAHIIFYLLQWMWAGLFVLLFLASLLPYVSAIARLDADQRAAARTGRIGALISATLFFVTTALLWAYSLNQLTQPMQESQYLLFKPPFTLLYQSLQPECRIDSDGIALPVYASCLFSLTTGTNANAFLALLGSALLLAISGILPSAWYESKPTDAKHAHRHGKPKWLWEWLNSSGKALFFAELVLFSAWIVLMLGYGITPASWSSGSSWVATVGGWIAASVPLAVLFRTVLPKAVTAILDIALDVSNWLKERPFEINPRGQILCRYMGLLRAIFARNVYDRVVIVSHSQGTVITADFLRLMQQLDLWPGTVDQRPEICLLTVGSPLRQLYAARFPQWYAWAKQPEVKALGVRIWVNAYRCGDYVGRDLWSGGPEAAASLDWKAKYLDVSLGLGAHTHYFDRTAPKVAEIIDWLIAGDRTLAEPPPVPISSEPTSIVSSADAITESGK